MYIHTYIPYTYKYTYKIHTTYYKAIFVVV